MKRIPQIFAGVLGFVLVCIFCWGFYGFILSGSGGPPSSERSTAASIGGLGYLLLLLLTTVVFNFMEDTVHKAYGRACWQILKITGICLLACFPLAIIFIGFIAPPFILAGSAIALFVAAFW